jgi:hypothetical protein
MSDARRVVLLFAALTTLGWALAVAGVTRLPSVGYVAVDVVFDVLVLIGLWLLWRPAWIAAVALTLLGELLFVFHPGRHTAVGVIGLAQLAVLALPQLRRDLRTRLAGASSVRA